MSMSTLSTSTQKYRHAIVIGGSITGFLAGRVLANHFRHVTIIERDVYPLEPAPRKGIPQSRFLHVLLKRGQLILEELFPGLADELVQHGAPLLRDSDDIGFYSQYGVAKKEPSSLKLLSSTRGLLDWVIRHRLLQLPNLKFLEGSLVKELVLAADQSGIGGVIVHTPNGTQTLQADLVIDASGKNSKASTWLQRLGYGAPTETLIDAHIGYAHRVYHRSPDFSLARFSPSDSALPDWKAIVVWPNLPNQTRSGLIFPVEGDRWIVGLGGASPDLPPTNEAEYLDYAKSLPTPQIYEVIKNATPLSDIYLYRGNENRLRAYEKLSPYPKNLLVMGHAACAFNPVYGQGMTMAAIEAQVLEHALHQLPATPRPGWSQIIQRKLAKAEAIPWSMATTMDQHYIVRHRSQSVFERFNNWYQEQLLQLVTEDEQVTRSMILVNHMLEDPSTLMAPSLLLKMLSRTVRYRLGTKRHTTSKDTSAVPI